MPDVNPVNERVDHRSTQFKTSPDLKFIHLQELLNAPIAAKFGTEKHHTARWRFLTMTTLYKFTYLLTDDNNNCITCYVDCVSVDNTTIIVTSAVVGVVALVVVIVLFQFIR